MKPYEVIIEADRPGRHYWREIWRYRELLLFLAWRDVLVRYKQTALGVAWALIRPLLTMTVFAVVFGQLAGLPSDGAPYPVLVCAAMLPWQLFADALTESSNSLISNERLISKTSFPRMIVPLSAITACLVDFLISLVILVGVMAWYNVLPSWRILALPFFVGLALATAAGAGIWLAALNVRFRDFRYVIPFIIQFGLYASPVGYRSSLVPEAYRFFYSMNPMVGVIDGFRWAILKEDSYLHGGGVLVSLLSNGLLLAGGVWYFRKTEQNMADTL